MEKHFGAHGCADHCAVHLHDIDAARGQRPRDFPYDTRPVRSDHRQSNGAAVGRCLRRARRGEVNTQTAGGQRRQIVLQCSMILIGRGDTHQSRKLAAELGEPAFLPTALVFFDRPGKFLHESRAVISDKCDDIRRLHDPCSTTACQARIVTRIAVDQKEGEGVLADYVEVPPARLAADLLRALLEEYVTRDGTDYGSRELTLDEKVLRLQRQLEAGEVRLVYESQSEQWDLVSSQDAARLLDS